MTGQPDLAASVAARLLNRSKATAEDPLGLTIAYWENPSRPAQMHAFARRAGLPVPATPGGAFTAVLHAFLAPVLGDLRMATKRDATWSPGGPWR